MNANDRIAEAQKIRNRLAEVLESLINLRTDTPEPGAKDDLDSAAGYVNIAIGDLYEAEERMSALK